MTSCIHKHVDLDMTTQSRVCIDCGEEFELQPLGPDMELPEIADEEELTQEELARFDIDKDANSWWDYFWPVSLALLVVAALALGAWYWPLGNKATPTIKPPKVAKIAKVVTPKPKVKTVIKYKYKDRIVYRDRIVKEKPDAVKLRDSFKEELLKTADELDVDLEDDLFDDYEID